MDLDFLLFLQNLREAAPPEVTTLFSLLCDIVGTAGPLALIGVSFWAFSKHEARFVIYTVALSFFANSIVKNIFCVYRPWVLSSQLHVAEIAEATATGYSFPSGHTMLATSIYGTTAWLAKRRWVTVMAVVLVTLTMFGRMWLGCHTPTDVLVGLALGLICMAFCIVSMRWAENAENGDLVSLVVGLAITVVAVIFLVLKPYPIDYAADGSVLVDSYDMMTDVFRGAGIYAGALIGWFIERRFINFPETTDGRRRAIRIVIGVAMLAVVFACGHFLLGGLGDHAAKFIEYFALLICAFVATPAVFKAARL